MKDYNQNGLYEILKKKKNYIWVIPLGIDIVVVVDIISCSLDCLQIHDPPASAFQSWYYRHISHLEMLGIILQLFLVIYKDCLDLIGVYNVHIELVYLFLSLQ